MCVQYIINVRTKKEVKKCPHRKADRQLKTLKASGFIFVFPQRRKWKYKKLQRRRGSLFWNLSERVYRRQEKNKKVAGDSLATAPDYYPPDTQGNYTLLRLAKFIIADLLGKNQGGFYMLKSKDLPLVLLNGDSPYTTSEIIANGTGMNHRRVRDVIRKYDKELAFFGKVGAYQTTLPSGQHALAYHLNEQQAAFLLTLLKNTPVVVEFKKELVRQFYAMRDFIRERQSTIWQDTRAIGKEIRRIETDAIKELVAYAEAQGSRHAARYYTSLSQLANRAAGITERDRAHVEELAALYMIEKVIAQEIHTGIVLDRGYRDIYQSIKSRLEPFRGLERKMGK